MLLLFIRRRADSRKLPPYLSPANFRKSFCKLSYDSVYRHLCNNDILTPHQSGFRPGDSTANQLLAITNEIYSALEATPTEET